MMIFHDLEQLFYNFLHKMTAHQIWIYFTIQNGISHYDIFHPIW